MNRDDFQIKDSLNDRQIAQLVEFTKSDPDILKFTSDGTRFKSADSYRNWLNKVRPVVYALSDKNGDLVGIGWITHKKLPEAKFIVNVYPAEYLFTSGIRVYGQARGQGIGSWFYEKILKTQPAKFWNRISAQNIASVRLHQKMGFIQVSNPDKDDKIFMIK